MAGFVSDDRSGWTELRVHGVAGTPPEHLLQRNQIRRVAGDSSAGFYRREWDAPAVSQDTSAQRLEAYSWGELTAGGAQRALWLLLTPFLLVNVAYWALPHVDGKSRPMRRAVHRVAEAVQRLFALTITLTLVLAAVLVSMDFVGWQCVRAAGSCTDRVSWLGFLNWPWLDTPGRRVVATALAPFAVVALLWWLANKTWARLESAPVPAAVPTGLETPLEDRRMWNGAGPVRRLRAVHVTAGLSVIALFLLVPVAGRDGASVWSLFDGDGPRPPDGWLLPTRVLMVAVLALMALSAVLVCLPAMSDREQPKPEAPSRVDAYTFLPWSAVAVGVLAGGLAWQHGAAPTGPVSGAPSPLPWFAATVQVLVEFQFGLLLVMLALLLVLRRYAPVQPVPRSASQAAEPLDDRPAWYGLTTAALMLLALVLSGGFAAGLGLRVGALLGNPMPVGWTAPVGADTVVVPMGYFWAAALAVPLGAVVLLVAGAGALLLRRAAGRTLRDQVIPTYPDAHIAAALDAPGEPANAATLRRARQIAAIWSRAMISSIGQRLGGIFVVLVVLLVAIGLVGYLINPRWIYEHASWVVNFGTVLVGGFVLGLLYVGRQAYRSPGFRRTVGIVWDIGTFWPRAAHPLAPPCYAERTVPELINRIRYLGEDGRLVLSCHSQGAVIGTAVVMQLTYPEAGRVALLTYGSPVRRLYSRFFPGYFNVNTLLRCGGMLLGPQAGDGTQPANRRRWPWRNLYRQSDPIGGPVLFGYPTQERPPAQVPVPAPAPNGGAGPAAADPDDNGDVDRQLVDPPFAKRAGDICYPPTCGHSDYFTVPAFDSAVATVRDLREPGTAPVDEVPRPAVPGHRDPVGAG